MQSHGVLCGEHALPHVLQLLTWHGVLGMCGAWHGAWPQGAMWGVCHSHVQQTMGSLVPAPRVALFSHAPYPVLPVVTAGSPSLWRKWGCGPRVPHGEWAWEVCASLQPHAAASRDFLCGEGAGCGMRAQSAAWGVVVGGGGMLQPVGSTCSRPLWHALLCAFTAVASG